MNLLGKILFGDSYRQKFTFPLFSSFFVDFMLLFHFDHKSRKPLPSATKVPNCSWIPMFDNFSLIGTTRPMAFFVSFFSSVKVKTWKILAFFNHVQFFIFYILWCFYLRHFLQYFLSFELQSMPTQFFIKYVKNSSKIFLKSIFCCIFMIDLPKMTGQKLTVISTRAHFQDFLPCHQTTFVSLDKTRAQMTLLTVFRLLALHRTNGIIVCVK